jgi:hypothetical protein
MAIDLDSEFFKEMPLSISIEMEDTGEKSSFVVFMQPLKVKDIAILNRIAYLQEKDEQDKQASMMLVSLMTSTLSLDSDQIPIEATEQLIKYFIEYNFTNNNKKDDDIPGPKHENINEGLLQCIDFLISNGHRYADIMEYPITLLNDFVDTAAERLGLKKKTIDPAQAFRQLGLTIRPRNSQVKKGK